MSYGNFFFSTRIPSRVPAIGGHGYFINTNSTGLVKISPNYYEPAEKIKIQVRLITFSNCKFGFKNNL